MSNEGHRIEASLLIACGGNVIAHAVRQQAHHSLLLSRLAITDKLMTPRPQCHLHFHPTKSCPDSESVLERTPA